MALAHPHTDCIGGWEETVLSLGVAGRRRLRSAIEWLPFGRDLFLFFAWTRLGIAYRGVYDSAEAAREHIRNGTTDQYDYVNELRRQHGEAEIEALGQAFVDTDYPLLFWLSQSYEPGLRVLELGGSLGQLFYGLHRRAPLPDDAEWTIAELPNAVEFGQEIADQRGERRLSFIDSDRIGEAAPCDLFLTAGTIQYMEKGLPEILTNLRALPSQVIVHNTPMHPKSEWWTRQNLGVVEVPYRIYSQSRMIEDMARLGYRQTAAWGHARPVHIPFHLDLEVERYLGFRFELTDQAPSGTVDAAAGAR